MNPSASKIYDNMLKTLCEIPDTDETAKWKVDGVVAIAPCGCDAAICVRCDYGIVKLPEFVSGTLDSYSSFLTKVDDHVLLVVLLENPIPGTHAFNIKSFGDRTIHTNYSGVKYGNALLSLLKKLQ